MTRIKALTFVLFLATLSATAFGQNANQAPQATPGTLNYVEGQASIEGRPLSPQSVGHATLMPSQVLATANGKAEILLTPGIFFRIAENSTVQMISPDLTHTEIRLEQGRASVEVDQIYSQNVVLVDLKNGQTQLLKTGLYAFDAGASTVRVFDGKASVFPGANTQANVRPIEVKGDRQLVLNGEPLKPHRFSKDQASADPFYKWSSLRSEYLGEANLNLAEQYAAYPGFYPGWYWAGGPWGYTWLPGDGFSWSPFGYGFYSPYYIRGGGFIYGHYGYGHYGYGHYGYGYHSGGYHGAAVAHAGGFGGGGFHGGGFGGGGFHGGGGVGGGHR